MPKLKQIGDKMNGDVVVRAARREDLAGVMAVERTQFEQQVGEGSAAAEEVMERRINLCNGGNLKWFLVAECLGRVVGYMILMPTRMRPNECDSWAHATDNGELSGMWDTSGDNMYVVSLAVLPDAPEYTSVLLVYHSTRLWRAAGKKVYMFCARMPGFAEAHASTGVSPEEYWKRYGPDGLPEDWMLRLYTMMSGGQGPHRLLLNGYPPDTASGGHGVLYAVTSIEMSQKGERRMLAPLKITERPDESEIKDGRVQISLGGNESVWEYATRQMVSASTIYVGYGCPDWGRCTFCTLDQAVRQYRAAFYGGGEIPLNDHVAVFRESLRLVGPVNTIIIFNAGSFLAMPVKVQAGMMKEIVPTVQRVVVESRPQLVTEASVTTLMDILRPAGIHLTVRIGWETQNSRLRNRVLCKGMSLRDLLRAVRVLHDHNVQAGAYVMLKPATGLDFDWARHEAVATICHLLGGVGVDEVYFGPTCVWPNTPLHEAWQRDDFSPPTLWETLWVLREVAFQFPQKVQLVRFHEEPPFIAVPSNHVRKGVPQDLKKAAGCDLAFHAMFDRYRATMDHSVLSLAPDCACRPEWFV